ncbi:hypothetical protein ACIBHY_29720 [Nonomuraea sp. NPDC050547]|uniref:hypothetical protein n=1 Tax=Nonomuraea sp. NPDC050547 TaxID=3364368 RepID=UPI0037B81EAD
MDLPTIARRFPLVARPRPTCQPLDARIAALTQSAAELAAMAGRERIARASAVCNMAALIASDCALPALARSLCWLHHDALAQQAPLPAWAAELALQPLLNLARQLIRQGEGGAAYQLLDELFNAAKRQREATIGERRIHLSTLTAAPDSRGVGQFLWTALLADGSRALAMAGRWQEAADHAARIGRGIGLHLLDGRQVTIIAAIERGAHHEAESLIDDSLLTHPWEQPVASLLRLYCRHTIGAPTDQDVCKLLDHTLQLCDHYEPATALFRARAAITAFDLAHGYTTLPMDGLRSSITLIALCDAYVCRELLAHSVLSAMLTPAERRSMLTLLRASGLDSGFITPHHTSTLLAAASTAEQHLLSVKDAD